MNYIPADKLISEIERYRQGAAIAKFDNAGESADYFQGKVDLCDDLTHIISSLQQEQPEVDLEKLKNKAELIANEIMIGVQANKYHTCIYNKISNDFNHSHLFRAALKGIELGLNARKEENK